MKVQTTEELSQEEVALLQMLGVAVSVRPKPVRVSFKIMKCVTTCVLCKTITIQFIQMAKYSDGSYLKEVEYSTEEFGSLNLKAHEVYKAKVKSCWACEGVLLAKEKPELVKMILAAYAPISTREEVYKYVKELRQKPATAVHLKGESYE